MESLYGDPMMNRETNAVLRYMWIPAVIVVGVLLLSIFRGDVFQPRGPGRGPSGSNNGLLAAAVAGDDKNAPAPSGEATPQPPAPAPGAPAINKDDTRLGGVITSSANTEEA